MIEEEERHEAVVKVMQGLAEHRTELPVEHPDGTRPIVVGLGWEKLEDVVERVMWSGGMANLFVRRPNGDIMILAVTSTRTWVV